MKTKITTIALGFLACAALAGPALADSNRQVGWGGQVDDTVIVRIHGDRVETRTIRGNEASGVSENVVQPLPVDRPVSVWLSNVRGRGSVQIVRRPSADDDFTTVIRIHDPQSGSGYYSFVLNWSGHRDFDGDGGWHR